MSFNGKCYGHKNKDLDPITSFHVEVLDIEKQWNLILEMSKFSKTGQQVEMEMICKTLFHDEIKTIDCFITNVNVSVNGVTLDINSNTSQIYPLSTVFWCKKCKDAEIMEITIRPRKVMKTNE
jgi:hypothetical protein